MQGACRLDPAAQRVIHGAARLVALEHGRLRRVAELRVAAVLEIVAAIPVRLAGKDQRGALGLTAPEARSRHGRVDEVVVAPVAVQIGDLDEAAALKELLGRRLGTVGDFVHPVRHLDRQPGIAGARPPPGDAHTLVAPGQQQAAHALRIALHRLDDLGAAQLRAVVRTDKQVTLKRLQPSGCRPAHERLVARDRRAAARAHDPIGAARIEPEIVERPLRFPVGLTLRRIAAVIALRAFLLAGLVHQRAADDAAHDRCTKIARHRGGGRPAQYR